MRRLSKGWCIVLMLCAVGISSAGIRADEVPWDAKNQAKNEALGDALRQSLEQASGIPVADISQMAGYFSAGDYRDGFLKLANIATDTAIGLIPVVGQVKFVASLEVALINAGKAYIDATLLEATWEKFKTLSESEQENWLNGGYDPIMTFQDVSLFGGSAYVERNIPNMRDLFQYYVDKEKEKEVLMQKAAEVAEEIQKAKYFSAAELYSPTGGEYEYSASIKLEWWAYDANYFQVSIDVNGSRYSVLKQLSSSEEETNVTPEVSLGDFGVDWQSILEDATESVTVSWQVKSARYDSTGLVSSLIGSDYVVGNSNFISIPDYDPIKTSEVGSFQLKPIGDPVTVTITSPTSGSETDEASITVSALVETSDAFEGTITTYAFLVNGSAMEASPSGSSFYATAQLSTGENTIIAGVRDSDGNIYASAPVTVNCTAAEATITITSPSSGSTTAGVAQAVVGTVEGVENVQRMAIFVNGNMQEMGVAQSFNESVALVPGDNTIQAGALLTTGAVIWSNTVTINSTQSSSNQYHVRITWGTNDTDVDLHLVAPDGTDCYYNNMNPGFGATLDFDDTDGYGPENITVSTLTQTGTYTVYVHYYSDHDNGPTSCTVQVFLLGQNVLTETRTISDGETWTVFTFTL